MDCALDHSASRGEAAHDAPSRWWWRFASGPHAVALADQAIVSGTSFLTLVLVNHWTSPSQLGLYSIGISVLLSTLAVQYALVSLPYTIQLHRPLGTPAEYAGMSLTLSGLFAALTTLLLAVTALGLGRWGAGNEAVTIAWVLAAVVPFALLREFARRYAFSHLRMGEALILDAAVAAIQFTALCWLGAMGRVSAAAACAVIGVACALSGMAWLLVSRGAFVIRREQVGPAAKRSWVLGKWLLAGQVTVSLQGYVTYWLLAYVSGSAATGIFAACMSVASVANPLMNGINNAIAPKAVLALAEGGATGLRQRAVRDAMLLGGAMSLFCLALFVGADDLMRLLFHGGEFAGRGNTVTLLGLGLLVSAVGYPPSIGLASLERPQAIVWAGAIGVVVTVVLGRALMNRWDLSGAAVGFLAGSAIGSAGQWIAFLAVVGRGDTGSSELVRRAQPWWAGSS